MRTNRWYKSGKTLLSEIAKSVPGPGSVPNAGPTPNSDSVLIWYMGQHGFTIGLGGKIFYIDVILNALRGKDGKDRRNYPPPFDPGAIQQVDYYICTHNHGDHLNLDTILPLAKANPETVFIVPKPWVSVLTKAGISKDRVLGACSGQNLQAGNVQIIPVPAIHTRYIQDEGEKDKNGDLVALGFVLKADGFSVYHPGDTWINPRLAGILKGLGPIDIAMLPINGTDWDRTSYGCIGNVSAMDAVKLALAVPVDLVIPCHYDMMPDNTENPAYFVDCFYRYCPQKRFHICSLGERFVYCR